MKLKLGLVFLLGFLALPVAAKSKSCPQSLGALSNELTQELPDYLNRTYTRLGINRHATIASYPDNEPLAIAQVNKNLKSPDQIFISVKSGEIGQPKGQIDAYWLVVVKTQTQAWRLVMAFSRSGNAPPQDVSNGAIANAVSIWLGDRCG